MSGAPDGSLAGWIDPSLGEELEGLGLRYLIVEAGAGRSPSEVRRRLRLLSDRFGGRQAVNLRSRTIPHAYRVFFRHIGLDPDVRRTPVEELVLERMRGGGFPVRGLPGDALTIATVESGVALLALDADRVQGRPGIRPSASGERLEGRPGELPPGTLVIADERQPLALLFGAVAPGREVEGKTRRTMLVAIGVRQVPDAAIEEALWIAAGALASARGW